jgi:RNA recognition motif-containing protein
MEPLKPVTIIKNRDTGEPRGFAFIEMTQPAEVQAAIASLNRSFLNERAMSVNEVRQSFIAIPRVILLESGEEMCRSIR